jgi:hypothetical protein
MIVTRYYRDGRPWDQELVDAPTWAAVEAAIRRMDNYCFPIVELNPTDEEDSQSMFNVVGGAGRWALFNIMGRWQYADPAGSNEEVRLQASDQGYFCAAKNVLTDIEKALRITREFYDTGSYDGLNAVR